MRFMDREFLLDTETAGRLYHGYAEDVPVFAYHTPLPVREIAEHRRFRNLAELWLEGDHYKWRAMRACGIPERLITGDAAPAEKFEAWAEVVPKLAGNPLYHWTHLELKRFFGIEELLCPETAGKIWKQTEEMLREKETDAVSLLARMKLRCLCTTDDPADSLEWHERIRQDASVPFEVRPSFRPDRYLNDPDGEAAAGLIRSTQSPDLETALEKALDRFCEQGCLAADQGLSGFPYLADPGFAARMRRLGAAYAERGLVMQLHLGAIRNNSPRLWKLYGPDAGADSIGRSPDPADLNAFLGDLEEADRLPRTILYNLNGSDNMMFSTLAVNFAPTVRFGAAWWFNDSLRGMERQLDELAETGALPLSVGMLTDSRSYTSFVRHEYYRRVLCRRLGRWVEDGLYPADEETLGRMVRDICYKNAADFFRLSVV